MSTAPAFSPGPCRTRGPVVGSSFRYGFADLDVEAVSDLRASGILAGSLQDARARRGELLQVRLRGLVRAVLAPERRVDPQLHEIRVAAEDFADTQELVRREPVLGHDGGGQGRGRESHGGVV